MSDASRAAQLSLTTVSRKKLAETVAAQLLREINAKRLAPGTKLPAERELMGLFGVGRSTVREAVNGLAMLGVLEIRHGQGAFIAEPVIAPAARLASDELSEVRRLVEVESARLAALARTDADLHDLASALEDHERLHADGREAVEPSVRFHACVARAAHNDVLARIVASLSEVLTQHGPILEARPGFGAREMSQHRVIYEAIRDRRPDHAARAMREHLDTVAPFHEGIEEA